MNAPRFVRLKIKCAPRYFAVRLMLRSPRCVAREGLFTNCCHMPQGLFLVKCIFCDKPRFSLFSVHSCRYFVTRIGPMERNRTNRKRIPWNCAAVRGLTAICHMRGFRPILRTKECGSRADIRSCTKKRSQYRSPQGGVRIKPRDGSAGQPPIFSALSGAFAAPEAERSPPGR